MSQYANIVSAEQPLPLPQSFYRPDAANAGSAPMPMTGPPTQGPHHQSANTWSQYYSDSPSLPHPASFSLYIHDALPSLPSSSSYASQLPGGAVHAPLTSGTSAFSASGCRDITNANSNHVEYQAQAQSLAFHDYPAQAQRPIVTTPSPRQSTTFPSLFTFGNTRQGTPSSHTSISDYGTGTKGWESPGLNAVEESRYAPSQVCVVDTDGSLEQVTEADFGSRHSSVPASTTTSSSSSHLSVKVEPKDPDDCFVMEAPAFSSTSPLLESLAISRQSTSTGRNQLSRRGQPSQSLAPHTEVPLRATGASEEMRGMMGVFRLNPFSMHSLSNLDDKLGDKDGLKELEAYCGEGQPLEEEPLVFEFQLALNDPPIEEEDEDGDDDEGSPDPDTRRPPGLAPEEEAQLRSFSPSFELHPEEADGDGASVTGVSVAAGRLLHDQGQSPYSQHEQDQLGELWTGTDSGSVSEVDSTSTASRSTHTPLSESPQSIPSTSQVQAVYGYQQDQGYPTSSSTGSVWDAVNEQYQGVDHGQFSSPPVPTSLPAAAKVAPYIYGHANLKAPRLHTTTSHPYLRKSLQNQQALHAHSQSLPTSSPQGYPHAPGSPQAGPSLLHPLAHRAQQPYQHILTQSSIQPQYQPRPNDYEQKRSHMYPSLPQGRQEVLDDVQHFGEPVSPAYMRPGRSVRTHDISDEDNAHVYPPRSHDGGGYMQSPYASPPANVQAVQQTVSPNRRWSLPEAGGGHAHAVGMNGHFLGNA
ncbi:hypothetical protein CVT26_004755 [Gymnopilus dilepis]|uniref:Uncharacterized protein n=1 Tax=Gymnopilus dilepis TaxID=231916 RepID=A0A409XZB1_9AGAR|nr:hypothetical protein CVT26_004755 [Gymnopilus dilepis]